MATFGYVSQNFKKRRHSIHADQQTHLESYNAVILVSMILYGKGHQFHSGLHGYSCVPFLSGSIIFLLLILYKEASDYVVMC